MLGERLSNRCPSVHRALMEVGRGSSSVPGGGVQGSDTF